MGITKEGRGENHHQNIIDMCIGYNVTRVLIRDILYKEIDL